MKLHALILLPVLSSFALAETPPPADPILAAMQQELAREKSDLIIPGMLRPYFIQYRLEDIHSYDALASYGALTRETESHQRVVRVEVRIGSETSDSSSARGDGSLELAPSDSDPAALKYALWTATDDAYKNALRAFATKRAALKNFQSAPTANDFTPAKAVTLIEPLATLTIDRDDWKHRLIEASGLFEKSPETRSFAEAVQYSSASISVLVVNRYTVNTDGSALRHGYSGYSEGVSVGGQAEDGMELGRSNGSVATTAAGLESVAALNKRVIEDLISFNDLRHAPIVDPEDYHGPVLFSGDASADVFNRLFVPNIEAERPEIGVSIELKDARSADVSFSSR